MIICSKKYLHETQKVKQQRLLKYLWLLNIQQKLRYGHLLGPGSGCGSGSGPIGPDPDPTKKVRIRPKSSVVDPGSGAFLAPRIRDPE
jgi:hypothetical protein